MNLLVITFLLAILITVLSIILICYKEKGFENFKNKKHSEEYCNEFAKDRCFYLRNTSDWYNCIQESLNYC